MILFLDTNIVIYALESHTTWGVPAQTRIAAAQAAGDTFMVSDLVRMECLVLPIRLGDTTSEAQYHAFFARSDVQVVAITAAVCDRATRIRARHTTSNRWMHSSLPQVSNTAPASSSPLTPVFVPSPT